MKGKYLITTDQWFVAPDGQQYKAVWGNVEITDDQILGIKTNARSSNWFAKIGSIDNHVIVAGCQIHYACRLEEKPSLNSVINWHLGESGYKEALTNTSIYVAE